ncbi:Helix-turn-helix domain protein [compost metagenome]
MSCLSLSSSPLPDPEAALKLSALGSLARLSVYRTLLRSGAGGATLAQLRKRTTIPASTLRHHLTALVRAGLVEEDRASRQLRCVARFDEIKRLKSFMLRDCCTQEHMLGTVAASNRF